MNEIQFKDFNLLDIGNKLEISGVLYGGVDNILLIMIPWEAGIHHEELNVLYPDVEEWEKIMRQSDLKEVEIIGKDKNKKIILRKSTRQIEQHIMWKVFRRDHYKCRYCGNDEIPLTVDHVVLWEIGGPSIEKNLICSCKKCNSKRGNIPYEVWLHSEEYKRISKNLSEEDRLRNDIVLNSILDIRTNHMRVNKRSR